MITGVITCALCGNDVANADTFLDHIEEHIWPLTRPDHRELRTRIRRDLAPEVDDEYRMEAVMHHVEGLIAEEWGPLTQGIRLDTTVSDRVSEQFSLIAAAFMLAGVDRVTRAVGEEAKDVTTSPQGLRWELKVSPIWQM